MVAGGAVPGVDPRRVARPDQLGRLAQPVGGLIDLARHRLAVGGEDVTPHRRVRPRDPGGVAKARTNLGQALGLLGRRRSRLLNEHVGDHVRKVADGRHQPVVGVGVDRLGTGAEVGDRALEPVVQEAAGALGGRQVPARPLEQVRARVLDPGGLGAGQRVPADEALLERPSHPFHQRPLGGADVGDRRLLATC